VSAKQDDTYPRSEARDALDAKLDDVRIAVAAIRAKLSIWAGVIGSLAGWVPAAIGLALKLLGSS
jgi:hypothetical protein